MLYRDIHVRTRSKKSIYKIPAEGLRAQPSKPRLSLYLFLSLAGRPAMPTVRLRLEFDDVLSKAQKTEELKQCWILLKPEHQTISDVASYLLRVFNLQNACPTGLLLSMEGFVLPPFESTCIFNDKDIIRVEKKGRKSSEVVQLGNDMNLLDVVEILDQPAVTAGMQLLANEEFEKQSGRYESELKEDDGSGKAEVGLQEEEEPAEVIKVSKKRKRNDSKKKWSSKRNKTKCNSAEKCVAALDNGGNTVGGEQNNTLSTTKGPKSGKAMTNSKRPCYPQENGKGSVDAVCVLKDKKIQSRNARRKKAKRQWLREQVEAEKMQQQQRYLLKQTNQQSSQKDNHQVAECLNDEIGQNLPEVPEKDNNKLKVDDEQPDKGSEMDDGVVPVVIRPGHIRYESRKKVTTDQTVQQTQISVESCQWNGVTSKMSDQNWGTKKLASHKRDDYKNDNKNLNHKCSRVPIIEEETPVYKHIEFDKLAPYVSLPKESDIIAYRMIELSSSWTPEISSYQVGKISRYDPQSGRITLMPVPEYPVTPQKVDDEESTTVPESCLYGEDGCLEIDFISLLEVRIVKLNDLNSVNCVDGANKILARDEDAMTDVSCPNNNNKSHTSARENREVSPSEEINKALDAKKPQLSEEDNWGGAESSVRRPWSYKALRGSALGPTMALLRSQNGL